MLIHLLFEHRAGRLWKGNIIPMDITIVERGETHPHFRSIAKSSPNIKKDLAWKRVPKYYYGMSTYFTEC